MRKESKEIEGLTLQCPKEKEQKDKALSTKHYKKNVKSRFRHRTDTTMWRGQTGQ
jgi:hypothetical protein